MLWRYSDKTVRFADGVEVCVANFSLHPTYAGWLMGNRREDIIRTTLSSRAKRIWNREALIFMGPGQPMGEHGHRKWPSTAVMVEFTGPEMVCEDGTDSDATCAFIIWLTKSDGSEGVYTLLQELVDQTELRWEDVRKPDWID